MSEQGMIVTYLATQLSEAVAKDDAHPDGHDIASGLFGSEVSKWLMDIATHITEKTHDN